MRYLKTILILSLIISSIFIFTACGGGGTTYFSYTFSIENGDDIEVKLNTSEGHKLTQEKGNFFVSTKDGKATAENTDGILAYGSFLLADDASWQLLLDDVQSAEILKEVSSKGTEQIYFTFGTGTYACSTKVANSNTGVQVVCDSEEDLEEAMSLLSFSVVAN